MASIQGRAVSIYNNGGTHEANLQFLERDDIKNLPLVTLSVTGEFRTGKSFLLSYFLRYLKNPNAKLGPDDEKLEEGLFKHAIDTKAVTQGVDIWNQPLTVMATKEDGTEQKVVVLLMDSEGLYGDGAQHNTIRTFVFTAMLSSLIILNVKGQINATVTQNLQQFTNYTTESSEEITDYKTFQNLMFLIRDWQKKIIHPFGPTGGNEYLASKPTITKQFGGSFDKIEGFLMPGPGDCVEEMTYDGRHEVLRNDFKDSLQELIDQVLGPTQLLKYQMRVAGLPITAGQFCDKFKRVKDLLKKVDWNQPMSLNELLKHHRAKEQAMVVFTTSMNDIGSSFYDPETSTFWEKEQLQEKINTAVSASYKKYKDLVQLNRLNGEELSREDEKELYEAIEVQFNSAKTVMLLKVQEVCSLLNCAKTGYAAATGGGAVTVGSLVTGGINLVVGAKSAVENVVGVASTALETAGVGTCGTAAVVGGISTVALASIGGIASGLVAAGSGIYLVGYAKNKLQTQINMIKSLKINEII